MPHAAMNRLQILETVARFSDRRALKTFLHSVPNPEQIRERVGREFALEAYDDKTKRGIWIVSNGIAFHAITIAEISPEVAERVCALCRERRPEFSSDELAVLVSEAMGFPTTHVLKRMDAEYERAMETIDAIGDNPPGKWKRKDMDKFTALLAAEEARWRAGLPMLYREELATAFDCDPVDAFTAGDYWRMTRRPEGSA